MSKNPLYANDIATANKFVIEHNDDVEFMEFLAEMRDRRDLMHSDRWALIYEYMERSFPEAATGTIITGLAYWIEG